MIKDAAGQILYVGKAKNLRNRVQAYFRKESKTRFQIDFLMRKTADIEYLITDNEKEALLLENTLIKKNKPRYNVFLKDDKSYASLKINSQHAFPGVFVTRHIVKDGSLYFGPYASASALRQTVDLVTKHFRLRTCSDHEFANRSRPCLEYHIGRCTAPCVGKEPCNDQCDTPNKVGNDSQTHGLSKSLTENVWLPNQPSDAGRKPTHRDQNKVNHL